MGDIVGGIANQGLTWLFDQFGEWTYGFIYKGLSKLANAIIQLSINSASIFWETSGIELFLDFSMWVNMIVLAISLLVLCMDIAEQAGRISWSVVVKNIFKGMAFVFFNRSIGLMTFLLASQLTSALEVQLNRPELNVFDPIKSMESMLGSGLMVIVLGIVLIIAAAAFICMSMLRNGTLFVQIMISAFYIPGIVRGDTAKLGEWLSRTVAISATFCIQFILFYIGLNSVLEYSNEAFILTGTCWLTMFFVPKALDRFGYSSGAGSVFSAAGSVAGMGLSFVK